MTATLPNPLRLGRSHVHSVIEVIKPGVQTTVQDGIGRTGMWDVGVPPSGAFDDLTFALVSAAVGNGPELAGLECVLAGPVLRFGAASTICVGGAATRATLDGAPVRPGVPFSVPAGAVLDVGKLPGPGMRGYLAVAGGIDTEPVLGSRSTFVLGKFGGIEGRPVERGDALPVGIPTGLSVEVSERLPRLDGSWELRVMLGPHGAPVHLDPAGAAALFDTTWSVDHRSDRTGVRLAGPAPRWARVDGGEAGLHPSNVHDSAYPVGGIMLSGDTPVVVGPDGPSLGGFVVPCVVIGADRWKLGQLRPGDAVRLRPVSLDEAALAMAEQRALLAGLYPPLSRATGPSDPLRARINFDSADERRPRVTGVKESNKFVRASEDDPRAIELPRALEALPAQGRQPEVTIRLAGDRHILVEAGPAEFDLTVRLWIHLLADELRRTAAPGITEIVEGVRSLLVAVDDLVTTPARVARVLADLAGDLADPHSVVLDVREVTLPIAFDHPGVHEAMNRYRSVNPGAPWNPDNVEFIRRMNDLDHRSDVFDVVSAATYLVVGLGDVYLGAPVAVPIDPRHRLVTTKYNPARTWTPQNAVGIGGIYLCVYGMEGPGGYQLVGRTVPVWRLAPSGDPRPGRLFDSDEQPWLLRQFDRLRFTPVSTAELEETRADILAGRADLVSTPARFSLAEVGEIRSAHGKEIDILRARRQRAFAAERSRWEATI